MDPFEFSMLVFHQNVCFSRLAMVFCVIWIFSTSAVMANPESKDEIYKRAESSMNSSHWAEAIAECDKLLVMDPKFAKAYFLRSKCRVNLGGTGEQFRQHQLESLQDLLKAKQLDERNLAIRQDLANMYAQNLKEYDKADKELTEIMSMFPDDQNVISYSLQVRSRVYIESRQFAKALKDYKRLSALDPLSNREVLLLTELEKIDKQLEHSTDALLYLSRAEKFYDLNLKKECLADCDKAIAIDPKLLTAYLLRARMTQAMPDQDNETALVYYNRAIEINPRNPSALAQRASYYFSCNKLQLAVDDYTKAIEISPSSGLYASRARMYNFLAIGGQKSLYTRALTDANAALGFDSKNGFGYLERANAYHGLGQKDFADRDYKRASELGVSEPD